MMKHLDNVQKMRVDQLTTQIQQLIVSSNEPKTVPSPEGKEDELNLVFNQIDTLKVREFELFSLFLDGTVFNNPKG